MFEGERRKQALRPPLSVPANSSLTTFLAVTWRKLKMLGVVSCLVAGFHAGSERQVGASFPEQVAKHGGQSVWLIQIVGIMGVFQTHTFDQVSHRLT